MRIIFLIIFSTTLTANAQLLDRIKRKAEDKIVQEVDKGLSGKKKNRTSDGENNSTTTESVPDNNSETIGSEPDEGKATQESYKVWSNYNFVPGDEIIFYDDLEKEVVGDFPSRWDLVKGGAEIVDINGVKAIIAMAKYNNTITPLFEEEGYLPDQFTVEYDIFADTGTGETNSWSNYDVSFDKKSTGVRVELRHGDLDGNIDNKFSAKKIALGKIPGWHHISIAYDKGKYQMYINEQRFFNIPKLPTSPSVFVIDIHGHASTTTPEKIVAIKNIKIAKGGRSMAERVVADGKYVTHGILFDTNQANVKPNSLGVIKNLIRMLSDNPSWKFKIVGHTDSDGDDKYNLDLSIQRAKSVMDLLVESGIQLSRLEYGGKGETEPLSPNVTPEQKANNRRVEFIKIN